MSDVKHDLYLAYRGHGYNRSDSIDISNRFYDSVLDDALKAAEKEKCVDGLNNPEDNSYDFGIDVVIKAIKTLKNDHQ